MCAPCCLAMEQETMSILASGHTGALHWSHVPTWCPMRRVAPPLVTCAWHAAASRGSPQVPSLLHIHFS